MYLIVITWKTTSSGSEDNHGSNASGSMPVVDELFKSGIMFDITKRQVVKEFQTWKGCRWRIWGCFRTFELRYTLSASWSLMSASLADSRSFSSEQVGADPSPSPSFLVTQMYHISDGPWAHEQLTDSESKPSTTRMHWQVDGSLQASSSIASWLGTW